MTEEELCQRCRKGDEAARRLLYEQYAKPMLGVCFRYAGDRRTAEDWLHDAFLKIYCSIDKFAYQGEGSLKAWMLAVLHNHIVERLRQQDVLDGAEGLDDTLEVAEDEAVDAWVDDLDDEQLRGMVAQLPVGQRTVFNMFVVDGKSHKEIAQMLGIKERSSSSQLSRARQTLATMIRKAQRKRQLSWLGMVGVGLLMLLLTPYLLYVRKDTEEPVAQKHSRKEKRPKRQEVAEGTGEQEKVEEEERVSVSSYTASVVQPSVQMVDSVMPVDSVWLADTEVVDTVRNEMDNVPHLTVEDYLAMLQEQMEEEQSGEQDVAVHSRKWSVNVGLSVNGDLIYDSDATYLDASPGMNLPSDDDPNPPGGGSGGGSGEGPGGGSGGGSIDIGGSGGDNPGGQTGDNEDDEDEDGQSARRRMSAQLPHQVVDSKNHYAWSGALSFRRNIGSGFSLETGVTYTLLTSDIRFADSRSWRHQQMHYVGIPLRVGYNWLNTPRWTSYVALGGEVERCVFGKQGSTRNTPSALQWSVDAAVGFQYNMTPHFGFYLEPGFNYYFDNGTGIPTRRTEAPLLFNVKIGVRFTR